MQHGAYHLHYKNSSQTFPHSIRYVGSLAANTAHSEGKIGGRLEMAALQPKLLTISHYPRCCGWLFRGFANLKVILICSLAINFIIFISMASLLPLKASSTEYFVKGYWDGARSAMENGRRPRDVQLECHAQMLLDFRNTTTGGRDRVSQTVDWGVYKTMAVSSFKKVQKFVLLTGFHRRHDGVVGTLLNAHPHAVISPVPKLVLDLEAKNYYTDTEKSQFYNFIGKFAFSRARDAMKKTPTPASTVDVEHWRYGHIPGLFAGVNDGHVNVYGVDMGETLAAVWLRDSRKVSMATKALYALVNIPIVVIHEVHHPYDSIALMACDYMTANSSLPQQEALHKAVGRYFALAQSLVSFIKNHTNLKPHFVYGYQLEAGSKGTLVKACAQLGMFCSKTFIDQSASVVAKNVSQPRQYFMWNKDMVSKIQQKMLQFSFLRHYVEQASSNQTHSFDNTNAHTL